MLMQSFFLQCKVKLKNNKYMQIDPVYVLHGYNALNMNAVRETDRQKSNTDDWCL